MIFKRLFGKVGMVALCCCLFFIFLNIFACTPLDDPTTKIDVADTQDSQEKSTDISEDVESEGNDSSEGETSEEQTKEDEKNEAAQEDEEPTPAEITINVYYADQMAEYLIPESRIIPTQDKFVEALYELMKKPIDTSLVPLVPDTTVINSVDVIEGNARVDLSQEFLDDRFVSDTVDILLLYSIVNTLTQFSEVNSVTLYIDGEKLDILGQLDIKEPVFRRNDLIKQG